MAVFAKVAELSSFRGAARALSLSPSVVSHHVAELEAHLSLPLLYRSTRGLSLTSEGEKFLVAAQEMVAAAERGLDGASGRSVTPSGTLRLTAPAFLAETALTRDLADFAIAHPRVRLAVSFTDAPRDLLRDRLDLALRAGSLADSTHLSRRLADLRRVLVVAPRYLRTMKRPRAPRDLAGWAFIQLSSRPPTLTMTGRGKKGSESVDLEPSISVDSAAAIRELVVAGAGLATLPEVMVRADLARGRLVEVLPGWSVAMLGIYAVWPYNAQRAGLTARFVEFMAPRVAALFGKASVGPAP